MSRGGDDRGRRTDPGLTRVRPRRNLLTTELALRDLSFAGILAVLVAAILIALLTAVLFGALMSSVSRPAFAQATSLPAPQPPPPPSGAEDRVPDPEELNRGVSRVSVDRGAQEGPDAVQVRAVAARSTVRPGDLVPIAVVLEHPEGYHSWPNEPVLPPQFSAVMPIATEIEVTSLPEGATAGEIQWPIPEPVTVYYDPEEPVDLLSYVGTAIAYLPVDLSPDQPLGETRIELTVRYQSCDENICYFPKTVSLVIPLQVVAADAEIAVTVNEPELFAGFGLEGFAAAAEAAKLRIPAYINVFGLNFSFDPSGAAGLGLLLLLAAVGGLLLNFTPCVLPIIPIKIIGLSKAAESPHRLHLLGSAMTAGVVAFWLVIGVAIAFVSGFTAISSLFQTGWFAPIVGGLVGLGGLGMIAGYAVRLPQFIYRIDPGQDTVGGSFGFGVMTAVLSTPCTAPFMAGASAWATLQRPAVTLAAFGAIGVGMAVPYLLLTLRPGLVSRIPRTGPASELIKQVMGFLMLAVAAFFIGSAISAWLTRPPEPPGRLYWWVVAGFVVLACGWLIYRTIRITPSKTKRAIVQAASLAVALLAIVMARGFASHGPIDWIYYTPERFEQAVSERDVVVLDFTAEWCLNCKVLESAVLHDETVVEVLGRPDVVPMRVDLTTDNPDGQARLRGLEWVGIPLLAIYGPGIGYDQPIRYDSYTVRMVVEAAARARAPSADGGG